MENPITEIFQGLIILLVVAVVCFGMTKGCESDHKVKCFNQTKDIRCWDLK